MSLNKMELNPQMLAGLYGNNLIEISATSMPETDQVSFQGGYEKQIMIIVDLPDAALLPEGDFNLLGSILTACHLSMADVGVINFRTISAGSFDKIHQESKSVLLFGVDPLTIRLPINFPFFQVQRFDKRKYLYAPALSVLGKDKTMKTKLWNALKTFFEL